MAKARFERDGDVGIITLVDPPLNLYGPEMVDDLEAALIEAESLPLRAVLVRADGEHFSGGASVEEIFGGRSEADARRLLGRFATMMNRAEQLPCPTVAAVQGFCLAAGLEMALACDMIWAGASAQLGLVEAVIGAIPFGGGAQRVTARAGVGRAREIVMTGGIYDAPTFERWNIVNRVVADDVLQEKTLKFAHRLASGPTRAHAATKRVLRAQINDGVQAADNALLDVAPRLFESEDMKGGIKSLIENGPGKAKFCGT